MKIQFAKKLTSNNYLGSILITFEPAHVATYKLPSESMVIPSGINSGALPPTRKS